MMLRSRITLIVVASFAGILAVIGAERVVQERDVAERHRAAVAEGDRHTWDGIVRADVQQLGPPAATIAADPDVVAAVAGRDRDRLAAILDAEVDRLVTVLKSVPQVEVITTSGEILFASSARLTLRRQVASPTLVRAAGKLRSMRAGIATRSDSALLITALAPIHTRAGLAAVVSIALPLDGPLAELAAIVGAEVDAQPSLATRVSAGGAAADAVTVADGRLRLLRTTLPLIDLLGWKVGRLQVLRDVTAETWRRNLIRLLSIGSVLCGFLLLIGFLQWYLRRAFRPLNDVIRVLNALAGGRGEVRFRVPASDDEIGRLAATVSGFRDNLLALQQTRAAKERIEGELAVARDIQLDILPRSAFELADREDLKLHAVMEPARAVGGDLYDFFMIDRHRLFFLIGDVSDKGVPSALFMAIVRTVFKVTMQTTDLPLGQLMAAANRYLCENNPSAMFVTIFAGILDTRSGRIEYCDGGHEPPLIRRADGGVEVVDKVGGLALGCVEDFSFQSAWLELSPGDTLVLYTDGVTEAANPDEAMFSTARMVDELTTRDGDGDPATATRQLLDAVRMFSAGAPQSDDITILALQYRGATNSAAAPIAA